MDEMYGGIYRAALARGVPAATLDLSPPHVVRMMFVDPDAPEAPESTGDYRERVKEVIAARAAGVEADHEPFDIRALAGL